jgi:hypothetical protein
VLSRYGKLENIPADAQAWEVDVTSPKALAQTFNDQRKLAFLFRDLATLRTDLPLFDSI